MENNDYKLLGVGVYLGGGNWRHPILALRVWFYARRVWKQCGGDPTRVIAAFEAQGFKAKERP